MKHYLLKDGNYYFMVTEFEDGYKSYVAIKKGLFSQLKDLYEVVELDYD